MKIIFFRKKQGENDKLLQWKKLVYFKCKDAPFLKSKRSLEQKWIYKR